MNAGLALTVFLAALGLALGVGSLVTGCEPAPSLDRAQAAFEGDNSWTAGRGYYWTKFRQAGDLRCKDTPDGSARFCIVMTLRVDPRTGESLGVEPEEFVCTATSCNWFE